MRIGEFEVVEPLPELEDAIAIAMLRPWVDVGSSGTLTLKILERQMTATELGRLARPGKFLDFTRERPVMKWVDGIRSLDIPNSVINYARDPATGRDFLFLHLREPHMYGEDYCDTVVELVKGFNVVEYCRIGGMYDQVPHTRPLKITGSLPEKHLDLLTGFLAPRRSTYQGPTSIVNLIGEGLEEAGIESSSLMVHLPHYVQLDEDYMATARLLEALCAMYNLPTFLANKTRGERQYEQIERALAGNDEVRGQIVRMEQTYDEEIPQTPDEAPDEVALPEDMEIFLRDALRGLDDKESQGKE